MVSILIDGVCELLVFLVFSIGAFLVVGVVVMVVVVAFVGCFALTLLAGFVSWCCSSNDCINVEDTENPLCVS